MSANIPATVKEVIRFRPKFYGIWIPRQEEPSNSGSEEEGKKDKSCVVSDVKELNKILKRNPTARFITAESEEEALQGIDDEPVSDKTKELETSLNNNVGKRPGRGRAGRCSLSALDNILKSVSVKSGDKSKPTGEEKDTRFPTPKVQELTAMGRDISAKRNDAVISRITANPRVLLTDCDVPTTVQEGCRYNALHVAAKCNNSEIIAYILNTICSMDYMKLVYLKDKERTVRDRLRHVADAYLNTPDKMSNETPLHFASKFLCVEAVEVLMSHPWCDQNLKNIYKEIPADIIGSRTDSTAEDFEYKKNLIADMLRDKFIIPIWRDPQGVVNPMIGEKASLKDLGDRIPKPLLHFFPNYDISSLGPCKPSIIPTRRVRRSLNSVFEEDIYWEVKAYSGPVSESKALQLYSALKLTSGRGCISLAGSPAPPSVLTEFNIPRRTEGNHSGFFFDRDFSPPRSPAMQRNPMSPPMSPYKYSPMFQQYSVTSPISPGPRDVITRRSDPIKGLERIAAKFSLALEIPFQEEWEFINYFGDILSENGLSILENYLSHKEKANIEAVNKKNISHREGLDCTCKEDNDKSNACGLNCEQVCGAEDYKRRDIITANLFRMDCSGDDEWRNSNLYTDENIEFFDCSDLPLYINGNHFSKQDSQLYAAMKDREEEISVQKYPLVFQWFNSVKSSGYYDSRFLSSL